VGKTSLISRFLTKGFDPNIGQSMGVDIRAKTMEFENLKVNLQIWDFIGQIEFRNVLLNYARGAGGGIFVYDITKSSSMKNIDKWLNLFKEKLPEWKKVPIVVLGNKSDLSSEREVSSEDAIKISKYHTIHEFLECSAKSGYNVEKAFTELAYEIMRRYNFT
jgi:small GTP-binding protein